MVGNSCSLSPSSKTLLRDKKKLLEKRQTGAYEGRNKCSGYKDFSMWREQPGSIELFPRLQKRTYATEKGVVFFSTQQQKL